MEQEQAAADGSGSQRRHFHVPARELLLPTPHACPFLPPLTLDGLAVTPAGAHHLIFSLTPDRMYFGPDDSTVTRRAQITAKALRVGASRLDPDIAEAAHFWIILAWTSMLDELVEALAAPALALL